jgi:chromosome partitioning protein
MAKAKGRIITVANQKGGVGKTTTVMNLGSALAREGRRVLLIDSDAQANLTSYLGVTPERALDELYLSKKTPSAEEARGFVHESENGIPVIPADQGLNGVEYYLFSRPGREQILSKWLETVRTDFDYIFIDTPPSLNLLTLNALVASTDVLIPVQPEFFSLEGIVKIQESIEEIRARWNPGLRIGGILITQANFRRKLTGEVIQTLKGEFPDRVLGTVIHENASIAESTGHARSVLHYAPGSKGAEDYLALGRELISREGSRR